MKKKSSSAKPSSKTRNKSNSSNTTFHPEKGTAINRYLVYGLLAAIILFVIFVRVRLLSFPLERDEGEYALMGQMILKGIPPYEMAYNMKLPGAYYLYAVVMAVFGQTPAGIHGGLLLVNMGSTVLLFFIGKKVGSDTIGLIAAASYALLSMLPTHLGFAAHATQFNVLFILGGVLSLLKSAEKPSLPFLILGGFLLGCSFIIKQHVVFLLVFGLASVALLEWQQKPVRWRTVIVHIFFCGAAMVLPYAIVLMTTYLNGTIDQFWHWTIEYAREYVGIRSVSDVVSNLKKSVAVITQGVELFWIFGAIGLVALTFSKTVRPYRWLILLFVICSLACVVPGYYFRKHYYILFLPALGLLIGITFEFAKELIRKWKWTWLSPLPLLSFVILFFFSVNQYKNYLFVVSPEKLCSAIYAKANPFTESAEIARYLEEHTTDQDKIAVLGSEPQIYFLSKRLPATGYVYTYPLTEAQPYSEPMQKDMIAEIEKNKPKFLVLVNSTYSWGNSPAAAKIFWEWYQQYVQQYQTVGIVELNSTGDATYVWGDALQSYEVKSASNIWISQLK